MKKLAYALFLLVLALLVGCASGQGQSDTASDTELIPLQVSVQSYSSFLPLYIAQEEGYYAEQGLDVELVPFNRGSEALVALVRGDIDIGSTALELSSFVSIAEGINMRYVADKGYINPDSDCTYTAWMTSNSIMESGVLDDLSNLPSLQLAQRAIYGSFAMDRLLEPVGLSNNDVNSIEVPMSAGAEAMQNGSVDLMTMTEPWITRTVNQGAAQVWLPWESYLGNAQLAMIIYGPSVLDDNRDAGNRFMVAYEQAVRQYNEGKTDRNVELMAEFTQLEPDEVRQMCWQTFTPDGSVFTDFVQDYQEWAVEKGHMDQVVPVEDYWDGSFLEHAQSVLDQ